MNKKINCKIKVIPSRNAHHLLHFKLNFDTDHFMLRNIKVVAVLVKP